MNKQILIVEDNLDLQESISLLLEEEGYYCFKANNGLEAVNILEKEKVDLVISDITMPELDGFGLFEYLQKFSGTHTIPFILLTANLNIKAIRKGMNLGIDDYLTKPFNADDLTNAVSVRLAKNDQYKKEIKNLRENIIKYVPHELRTPLVSIIGYSDILYKEYSSLEKDQALEMLSSIKKSGSRLFERLEKFLILAELDIMDSHIGPFPEKKFRVCKIEEKQIFRVIVTSPEISDRQNDIIFSMQDCVIAIMENHFHQIIKEIVSNACKFSAPDSKILINGKINRNSYLVRVFDTGLGMSKKEISELGAFRQFNREQYQQVGNGLGLYVVQRLLQLVKGELKIMSYGKKVLVKISIPLHNNIG